MTLVIFSLLKISKSSVVDHLHQMAILLIMMCDLQTGLYLLVLFFKINCAVKSGYFTTTRIKGDHGVSEINPHCAKV